ncbi:hypothetical protein CR513_16611, partial [Mucuna pruriens]
FVLQSFYIGGGANPALLYRTNNWKAFNVLACSKRVLRSCERYTLKENDCVFMFLARLNKELGEVRGKILGKTPLPTIRVAFSEVKREEARQRVMLNKLAPIFEVEGFALVAKNHNEEGKIDDHGAIIANVH